jgi:hypothetical protein
MAKRGENKGERSRTSRGHPAADVKSPQPTDSRLAWMERTRVYRAIRERDMSLETPVAMFERQCAERQRAIGDVIDLWNSIAPAAVRTSASITSLAQGTLTISVASSSASFELSRVLRDGLERTLIDRMPTRIRRVKVRVGADDSSDAR